MEEVHAPGQDALAASMLVQQYPGQHNGLPTAPLGAEHAPQEIKQEHMQLAHANGQEAAHTAEPSAAAAAAEPERKRRHKWGPPAAGEFANQEQKPKKRKSRWESSTDIIVPSSNAGQILIPGQLPKEVTICGGLKVRLQAAVAVRGPLLAPSSSDCYCWAIAVAV